MEMRRLIALCTLLSAATLVAAQQLTVSQLVEAGASRLDAAAFKAAFVGKYLGGYNAAGAEWKGTFEAEGRYLGTSYNMIGGSLWARGRVLSFYGPWTVDEQGKVCYSLRFSPGTGQRDDCIIAFELKGELYVAGDAGPDTPAFVRKPEKKPFWW